MSIKAEFLQGETALTVHGLHQWDYGQKLEIHGLALPAMIEVHFACLNMTEAIPRIGTTADGVTTVAIPDGCLEHDTPLRAWVYVVDTASGKTERTIHLPIQARTKPQGAESRPPFAVDEYKETLEQINKTVDGWRDGIVDQNDGGKTKIWTGTRAEFNALEETDDHTMYVITDELPDYTELLDLYTKLNADLADMDAVMAGTKAVPKATKASQDADGRNLGLYGYFGSVFQKVTQLTEAGVYQMYLETSDNRCMLPLVSFDGTWNAKVQTIRPDGGEGYVKIQADGSIELEGFGTLYTYTVYARRLGFSGWAAG
jgi:hypothetical protein